MHITTTPTSTDTRDDRWLTLSSQITRLVNTTAGRYDLIAYAGDDAAKTNSGELLAPALFYPLTAIIEVNTEHCFKGYTPETVDISTRAGQLRSPAGMGAIFHEAYHARFTTWDMSAAHKEVGPKYYPALMNLEETRMEALAVIDDPDIRIFLRACALEIAIGDMDLKVMASLSTTRQAAHTVALTLARVSAGVLKSGDVTAIRKVLTATLGRELLSKLRKIWVEFQSIDDMKNVNRMYELAREWTDLVEAAAEAKGEPEPGSGMMFTGSLEDLIEALTQDAGSVGTGVEVEVNQEMMQAAWDAIDKKKKAEIKARMDSRTKAESVFGHSSGKVSGRTSSVLKTRRPASSAERVAANTIARELARSKYRDRVRVVSSSVVPPGRLRGGAVLQQAAMRSQGQRTLAEPWRRVQHQNTEDPSLTVGVMVDISGSMGGAMESMAVTAWVLSEAVRRVQGTAAMVYYGDSVFPTLRPGQHLDQVEVYTADDGSEDFNTGFMALDGQLNLLYGRGARLLVVVSDGEYGGHGQAAAAHKWLAQCEKMGVAVLWLGHGSQRYGHTRQKAQDYTDTTNAVYLRADGNVISDAYRIGRLAAQALTRIGNRV